MLTQTERHAVVIVSKVAPWFAPLPSAYFVGRSSMKHLDMPWLVAVVVALVIECLGIATVHNLLWMTDWNRKKRKTDPVAPTWIAVILGLIYVFTTISLTVVLETLPKLSIVAPAMFPFLALVGGVNIALIAQQEKRELDVQLSKAERSVMRSTVRATSEHQAFNELNAGQLLEQAQHALKQSREQAQQARRKALLDALRERSGAKVSVSHLARALGASRTTIYKDIEELERVGLVDRSNGDVGIRRGEH